MSFDIAYCTCKFSHNINYGSIHEWSQGSVIWKIVSNKMIRYGSEMGEKNESVGLFPRKIKPQPALKIDINVSSLCGNKLEANYILTPFLWCV